MTLYYVRLMRETEKAYLFLAETERDAEEYARSSPRDDPESVARELVFRKDAEKWVDEGVYPPPSFAGKLRPKCIRRPTSEAIHSLRSDRTRSYAPIVTTRMGTTARTSSRVGRTRPAITGIRATYRERCPETLRVGGQHVVAIKTWTSCHDRRYPMTDETPADPPAKLTDPDRGR